MAVPHILYKIYIKKGNNKHKTNSWSEPFCGPSCLKAVLTWCKSTYWSCDAVNLSETICLHLISGGKKSHAQRKSTKWLAKTKKTPLKHLCIAKQFHIFQTELTTELSINVILSVHFGQLNWQNSHINMMHHKICQYSSTSGLSNTTHNNRGRISSICSSVWLCISLSLFDLL